MDTVLTTVRLPAELHEALRRRAFEDRRAIADIIREAVLAWLTTKAKGEPLPALEADPLWEGVGTVPGGPPDEAERHDAYLYADRAAEAPVAVAEPGRGPRPGTAPRRAAAKRRARRPGKRTPPR